MSLYCQVQSRTQDNLGVSDLQASLSFSLPETRCQFSFLSSRNVSQTVEMDWQRIKFRLFSILDWTTVALDHPNPLPSVTADPSISICVWHYDEIKKVFTIILFWNCTLYSCSCERESAQWKQLYLEAHRMVSINTFDFRRFKSNLATHCPSICMYCAISYCPVSIMIGEPLGNDSDFLSVKVYLRYSTKQDKHMRIWGLCLAKYDDLDIHMFQWNS